MGAEWITDAPSSLKTFSGRQRGPGNDGREGALVPQNLLPPPVPKCSKGRTITSGQETVTKHLLCARHCARGRDSKVSKTQSLPQLSAYDVPISLHSSSHLTLTMVKCCKNHPQMMKNRLRGVKY